MVSFSWSPIIVSMLLTRGAAEEVPEAWVAKAYVSVHFPDVEKKSDVSVEQLASAGTRSPEGVARAEDG